MIAFRHSRLTFQHRSWLVLGLLYDSLLVVFLSIATILLTAFSVLISIKKPNLKKSLKTLLCIQYLSKIHHFSLNYVIFYMSTQYLISGFVALCFSSILFMNVINNIIFHRKSPKIMTIIGGVIGTFGLIVIFFDELISFELSSKTSYGISSTLSRNQ